MADRQQRAGAGRVPASPTPLPALAARRLRRIWIPLVLGAAVIAVLAGKAGREAVPSAPAASLAVSHSAPTARIPRLIDLGADKCIPCKAMAPILVELRAEYAGRMKVDFIDVWKDPRAGEPYRIYAIPTQIFFDGDGKELARHEGFISKTDILATWQRLGYDFGGPGAPESRH